MSDPEQNATNGVDTEAPQTADSNTTDEATADDKQIATTSSNGSTTNGSHFNFADMRLAVGDRLQVQLPDKLGVPRTYVRLLGYFDRVGLIVTAPMHKGVRVPLIDNEHLIIRVFTRQSAFAFNCSVLRVSRLPYDHLHLSFPQQVRGTIIRKATRVKSEISVSIKSADGGDKTALMQNISASGALLLANNTLGQKGDTIQLSFQLDVHGCNSTLEVQARILHLDLEPQPATDGETQFLHGVEFIEPSANTVMLLKGFVYQQIIEQPSSLV